MFHSLVIDLNVLFYNAATSYYHKDAIKKCLASWPNPNNLLKAVNEDVNNNVYLAEVRALGIIDKLLTGPLWRLIDSCHSVLELNPFLLRLKVKLTELCSNASSVLPGGHIFDDTDVKLHDNDNIYSDLFEGTGDIEFDVLTQQAVEVIFHAFLIILERQCAVQLPGGK